MVSGSDLIAYGRVVDVRPEWADQRRRIDSVVTAEVLSWFKGGSDRTLSFVVPGGEIGRYRQVTIGAPSFAAGEEAFLFLKTQGSPMPYVFGLNQGVFRVRTDDSGARNVTTPALLAVSDQPETVRRGAVTRRPMAVGRFHHRVPRGDGGRPRGRSLSRGVRLGPGRCPRAPVRRTGCERT